MKHVLLILDDWEGKIESSSSWKGLEGIVEVRFLKQPIADVLPSTLEDVDFLMALRERTTLNEDVFAKLPKLKLILQTGGHAYHIDLTAAAKLQIKVALGRRIKAPLASVPELTFAMALGLMHLMPQAQTAMREGKWPLLTGRTLFKKRLGILGMGRHGSRVASIAKDAFGMEVVAWDRPGSTNENKDNISRLPLNELLASSDLVSIHLKLTNESIGLMNADNIAKMKPGAILINTSRGAIMDEPALISALQSGRLSGAGLDVFTHEPLSADSPLRSLENVMLTPHIGWTVKEVFEEFAQIASTQLQEYLKGTLHDSELI